MLVEFDFSKEFLSTQVSLPSSICTKLYLNSIHNIIEDIESSRENLIVIKKLHLTEARGFSQASMHFKIIQFIDMICKAVLEL